jgi:flap endonuclease-1
LFGALRLVRNLAITGRRKLPKKPVYVKVLPELIELDEVLAELRITREQLIDICILVGTDFNPDGVKGFGPRTAWKLIQEYGSLERALPKLEAEFPADPSEIKRIFLEPEVTDSYHLTWDAPSEEGIVEFLCDEKDFSEERVRKAVGKAVEGTEKLSKRPELKSFF